MKRLILTNGDRAAERINRLDIAGDVLPWRDVLHDGPVYKELALAEQSAKRAAFLAGYAQMPLEDIQVQFQARDKLLLNCEGYERIELWFEHDLYDQLQVMQILSCLCGLSAHPVVYLMQSDDYLSEISDDAFAQLPTLGYELNEGHLKYGDKAWQAFTDNDPKKLIAFLVKAASLPYIAPALRRLLAEYPDTESGLPLSLQIALLPLLDGTMTLGKMFLHMSEKEEAKFMGDLSFAHLLGTVIDVAQPLIKGRPEPLVLFPEMNLRDFFAQEVVLTPFGVSVLAGEANHVRKNGIDRWLGGVHLCADHVAFYDRAAEALLFS